MSGTEENPTPTPDPSQGTPQPATGTPTPQPTNNPAATQTEPTGGPDWQKAAEQYRQQRDEERTKAANLQKQLDDLNAKGDIDALKAQLQEQQRQAEEAANKAERDRINIGRLAKEGCIDIDVALSLLDENGDVEALKQSKPYLFGSVSTGSTGFKPSGSASGAFDAIDKAMGLEPPK